MIISSSALEARLGLALGWSSAFSTLSEQMNWLQLIRLVDSAQALVCAPPRHALPETFTHASLLTARFRQGSLSQRVRGV